MAAISFHAVTSLPGTLQSNAFYFVENGTYTESYLTNSTGTPKSVGNSVMINALINAALADFTPAGQELLIEESIAARDALNLSISALVLVIDASADPTVATGSAMYAWNNALQTWLKVAEYESMDLSLEWGSISGRPSSTPAQIDSAVSASHSHTNLSTLNKLTEVGGTLRYNGAPVSTEWATVDW